jgi:heme exporter protein D
MGAGVGDLFLGVIFAVFAWTAFCVLYAVVDGVWMWRHRDLLREIRRKKHMT